MPGRSTRSRTLGLLAVVLGLHVVAFGLLFVFVVPARLYVGAQVFGFGLGVTAYVYGLRHAFDPDHVAAIDNTTRKLVADGQRPVSVGFWFAMGHSTVVAILAVAVAVAILIYDMPVSQTLLSASEGAIFGFFPILWVVINAIWVYNLTVATGHFDVLRRSFEKARRSGSSSRRTHAASTASASGSPSTPRVPPVAVSR